MSTLSDTTVDDLQTLASTNDMYDRLTATLNQQHIDESIVRATILQIVGAPSSTTHLGENIRGDIHLAVVSDASANLSRFFSAVIDLAPEDTAHLNGTNTSLPSVVGSVSDESLVPGPLVDEGISLTAIEKPSAMSDTLKNAFQQLLDTGSYSFAKEGYHETVSAPGSILIGDNPKYGDFDEYESITDQLNLPPEIIASVDLTLVNKADQADELETSAEQLSPPTAREYLSLAQNQDPVLTQETTDEFKEFISELEFVDTESTITTPSTGRLVETLARFSIAHARLRLADQTTKTDAQRATELVENTLTDMGLVAELETGKYEPPEFENELGDDQRDKVNDLKQEIEEIEQEWDNGAPVDVIIERMVAKGVSQSEVENQIDELKRKGEVYEPILDHLRVA